MINILKHRGLSYKLTKVKIKKKIENSLIIKFILPKKDSYYKTKNNFKRLGIETSIEMMVFYKLLLLIIAFITIISLYNYYIYKKQHDIIYGVNVNTQELSFTENKKVNVEDILIKKVVEKEQKYNGLINRGEYSKLFIIIKSIESEYMINDADDLIAKSVMQKLIYVNSIKIKPYIIFWILVAAITVSNLINVYIKFKLIILETKIDEEVNLIQMLTFILIKNNNISVFEILKKQRDYAKILKPYYNRCISLFPTNDKKAIEYLKEEINNSEFNKFMLIIENNLVTDRETNIKLLEANKNLSLKLIEEKNKKNDDRKGLIFTILTLPVVFLAYTLLFGPLLFYAATSLK